MASSGATVCHSCVYPETTGVGATNCTGKCDIGYYYDTGRKVHAHPYVVDQLTYCDKCVDGMVCESAGVSLWDVELEKGYWRQGRETNDVRECDSNRFCSGGDGSSGGRGDGRGPVSSQQPLTSDAYCRETYEGPLW